MAFLTAQSVAARSRLRIEPPNSVLPVSRIPGSAPPIRLGNRPNNNPEPPLPKRRRVKDPQILPEVFQDGSLKVAYNHLKSTKLHPAFHINLANSVARWRLHSDLRLKTNKYYYFALNQTNATRGEKYFLETISNSTKHPRYWTSEVFTWGRKSKKLHIQNVAL